MTAILVFIILFFIGICQDDYSLIIGIGKIIAIGALVVFFLFCLTQPILLITISVIVILIVMIISHYKKNSNSFNNKEQNLSHKYETLSVNKINSTELSDFQKKLRQNSKTPQQVEDESWLKEKEQIILIANNDFTNIKQKLLDKAKNGQYTAFNDQKYISVEYYCPYLLNCVDRQYSSNPTGRVRTSSYRTNEKAYYHINKVKQYNLYLTSIKELALKDNISINPVFKEMDVPHNRENRITLPYTFTNKYSIGVITHKITAYLECSIKY